MYALADCNNFFVSCERVFRPDLQKKPVLVLSGNDGCVIARSNETKALGIKMGVPFFQIKDIVTQNDIVCFSSNFSLYGDLSARVMKLLSRHTHRLEQYSIDEAFLDLSHVPHNEIKPLCERIVQEVWHGIGVPISIGIAPSKTLAKVASKYAKSYPGYHGACMIDTEEKRKAALRDFEIGDVWGIGRQARKKLEMAGITSALMFAAQTQFFAKNLLHKPGENTWLELNGEDVIDIRELPEKQSITQSRTFAEGVSDRPAIEKYLADFTASCARKLRAQHSLCTQISFFCETSRFCLPGQYKCLYATIPLHVATGLTIELQEQVLRDFRKVWDPHYLYKRAGVVITGICSEKQVQQDMFDTRNRSRDNRLQKAIDSINSQFGKQALVTATQVQTEKSETMLHSKHLSPCYSTNLKDIITVHC